MQNPKNILIVEDEKPLMMVLHDKLVHEGYHVLQAENGKIGLETALEHHPDLILLDLMMPEMDGMTVLKKLREDAWGKTAPVFILTNLSDGVNIDEGLRQNVVGYFIKKDWKLEDMVVKIKETLAE